jgi:hypothetical protein
MSEDAISELHEARYFVWAARLFNHRIFWWCVWRTHAPVAHGFVQRLKDVVGIVIETDVP